MNTINFSVTQNGIPLSKNKYTWDEKTKVFSSVENNLVLDFSEVDNVTFKTDYNCTFKTGYGCTFNTGYGCTFNTGSDCTFKTDYNCTFKTGYGCTFNTGSDCTFNTGSDCTFKTDYNCTFKTGYGCTFNTGSDCTFNTGSDCTFKTEKNCVIVRRDVFEVIQLVENQKIKLNESGVNGFKIVDEKPSLSGKQISVTIDGNTYSATVN